MPVRFRRDSLTEWYRKYKPEVVLLSGDFNLFEKTKIEPEPKIVLLNRSAHSKGYSGIDQNFREIGSNAADLVVTQLLNNEKGIPRCPKTVLVEGIYRE